MRQAYIYVSTLNPELEQVDALAMLNRNRKEWQSSIGRRLGLKFTPQLIFRFDDSIERGDRVMEILTKLKIDEAAPQSEEK
jgi:ribosome-binding factor A